MTGVSPLATTGWESYRKNYQLFFDMYQGSLDVEFRDLRIVASKDVAFIHCLQRTSGTLKGGLKDEMWVRITSGLRKINEVQLSLPQTAEALREDAQTVGAAVRARRSSTDPLLKR